MSPDQICTFSIYIGIKAQYTWSGLGLGSFQFSFLDLTLKPSYLHYLYIIKGHPIWDDLSDLIFFSNGHQAKKKARRYKKGSGIENLKEEEVIK